MLLPRAKSEGKWTTDLIKPYGIMVRNYLRGVQQINKRFA